MRYTNKKILKITFPVLVCLLMEQLIGLTDTAYLGRVGEAELGASALAGIFYLMIFMLGFGFSAQKYSFFRNRIYNGLFLEICRTIPPRVLSGTKYFIVLWCRFRPTDIF